MFKEARRLFDLIKISIFSPHFYQTSLLKKSPSFSFKYFFSFYIILAFLFTIFLALKTLPSLVFILKESSRIFAAEFPDDLKITLADGKLSTNYDAPVYWEPTLYLKSKIKEFFPSDSFDLKYLLVIDPMAEVKNSADFNVLSEYNTLILVTSSEILGFYRGFNFPSKIELKNIKEIDNQIIDKKKAVLLSKKIDNFLKWLPPVFLSTFFIYNFLNSIYILFYLVFLASIVWLIYRLNKFRITYKKAYQIGLHVITAGLLLDFLLIILNQKISLFTFTLLASFLLSLNLFLDKNKFKSFNEV